MTKSRDPLVPELEQILPDEFAARITRPGIVNAMHHEGFNKAVKALGRKKLFVAGITTEICVTFPVLQILDEGYEVQAAAALNMASSGLVRAERMFSATFSISLAPQNGSLTS